MMEHRPIRQHFNGVFTNDLQQVTQKNPGQRKSVSATIVRSATSALLFVTIIAAIGVLIERGGICLSKYARFIFKHKYIHNNILKARIPLVPIIFSCIDFKQKKQ